MEILGKNTRISEENFKNMQTKQKDDKVMSRVNIVFYHSTVIFCHETFCVYVTLCV